MNTPENTQMNNPPKDEAKMINPPVAETKMTKKVRVRLIRAVSFSQKKGGNVIYDAGTVLDVTPATAHQLCDVKLGGQYSFSGERLSANADKHFIVRAVRAPDEQLTKRPFKEQGQEEDSGKLELAE